MKEKTIKFVDAWKQGKWYNLYTDPDTAFIIWQARQSEIDALEERYKLLDAVFEALKETHDRLCNIARMQGQAIIGQKEEIARLREALDKIDKLTFSEQLDGDKVGIMFVESSDIHKILKTLIKEKTNNTE